MNWKRIAVVLALLSPLMLFAPASSAQDAVRGNTLYHTPIPYGCDQCHNANPKNDPEKSKPSGGVKTGATDWHYIQQGINSPVDGSTDMMDALNGFYNNGDITDQDLIDISAYLAQVFGLAGSISAPSSAGFGSVNVGSFAQSPISVTISGAAVAFSPPYAISGANAGDFTVASNTCIGTKNPGSCIVNISFTPTAAGARSASVTITSGAGNPVVSLSGTGVGVTPPGQLSMPGPLNLGSQTVGTQGVAQQVTVTNTGGAAVSISSVASGNAAEFILSGNTCSGSIAASATCHFSVAFKPSASGARSSSITVTSNGVGSPQSFTASGTGTAGVTPGQLTMPSPLSFGSQPVGVQSAAQAVTISNTGGQSVSVSSVASSNAAEFPVTANTCASVAAGATCSVSIAFNPSTPGARNATITVTSNGTGSPQTFGASGSGTSAASPGQLSMPGPLSFGAQPVGVPSGSQSVTISNVGGQSVSVSSVSSSNASEFAITTNTCANVAAGGSCTIGVAFTPSTSGVRNASITVVSSGSGSPQTFGASGTGTSAAAPGQLSMPASIAFGNQTLAVTSAAQTVTVINAGGQGVNVSGVASANAAEFAVTANACNGTIAAGASCQVSIAFTPSATGVRGSTITITSNGVGSPQTFTASGTGVAQSQPGQLSMPAPLNFGTQPIGVQSGIQTVNVTNTGGQAVSVSSVASSNGSEFLVVSTTCTGAVAAGSSCQVSVAFKPSASGGRNGDIVVTSTGAGNPQSFAATGTGTATATPGQLSLPSSIALPSTAVGVQSAIALVTVANVGGAGVTVNAVTSANLAEFPLLSDTCSGSNVPPGGSCQFGIAFKPSALGPRSASITLASTGIASPQVVTATGTGTDPNSTAEKIPLVEYYHAQFDHYFVTGIADEIAKLDNGTFAGWQRTGLTFTGYAAAKSAASGASVCRFFSVAFAPLSGHFYTALQSECDTVKANPDWHFEGEVFNMVMPGLDGSCPVDTKPVYRLYNDGQGGAPNHRFTTDLNVRSQMIAKKWVPEGYGIGVTMCSPN